MADCGYLCHTIYPRVDGHTTQRRDGRRILGNKAQFCGSFYHVHELRERRHSCLDENNCTIAVRAKEEKDWKKQPKTVVAFAKFEVDGETKYEARYTNCYTGNEHAEESLDTDIRFGQLSDVINETEKYKTKSITMYLTYQPCNKSTAKPSGTTPDQSCCDTLKKVYSKVLKPKTISLCIKATHTLRLDESPAENATDEELRKNAICGIQKLMESGVTVSGMEKEDWEYLSILTSANIPDDDRRSRNSLDASINKTFAEIATWHT